MSLQRGEKVREREREDIYTCKSIYRVCLSRIVDITETGDSVATSSSSSSSSSLSSSVTGLEGFFFFEEILVLLKVKVARTTRERERERCDISIQVYIDTRALTERGFN